MPDLSATKRLGTECPGVQLVYSNDRTTMYIIHCSKVHRRHVKLRDTVITGSMLTLYTTPALQNLSENELSTARAPKQCSDALIKSRCTRSGQVRASETAHERW